MTQNGVQKCTIFPRMALKQTFSLFAVKEIHLANVELPNAELPNAELLNAELPNAELLNAESYWTLN